MIKKHRNKNEYYYSGNDIWIRNFTKQNVIPEDINHLITVSDMDIMVTNEANNSEKLLQRIDTELLEFPKVAIIGDGYGFHENQSLLELLPSDVVIFGTNMTLNYWNNKQKMHFYVVNNPYEECLHFLPKNQIVWPRCIASVRTNNQFINRFNGIVYTYNPVTDEYYSGIKSDADYYIDDYRSAICASIGLAYKFHVKRLMIFWCEDLLKENRPGAEKLKDGLWIYPQQKLLHDIIDGNLYWLKNSEKISVGYHSYGLEYKHGAYISKENITNFFGVK